VKLSELQLAVEEEFGSAYGAVVLSDVVLAELGSRTAREALDRGIPTREVWLALCRAMDVPDSRRHGAGRRTPRPGVSL